MQQQVANTTTNWIGKTLKKITGKYLGKAYECGVCPGRSKSQEKNAQKAYG